MRILLAILLAFCFTEIYFLIKLAEHVGALPVFALIAASAYAGWQLVRHEYRSFLGRIFMPAGLANPPARNLVAGILLIVPGLLSDIAAIALLLWPKKAPAREDGIIEGSFHRID